MLSGAEPAPVVYILKKSSGRSLDELSPADLDMMLEFEYDYHGVKCVRVTDKAKEQLGTLPAIYYEPAVTLHVLNAESGAALERIMACCVEMATPTGSTASLVILPPQALVFVKPYQKPNVVCTLLLLNSNCLAAPPRRTHRLSMPL